MEKTATTHTAIQLDGENMMTVSLKVKCHENPLMVVMNRTLVCMQHAETYNMHGTAWLENWGITDWVVLVHKIYEILQKIDQLHHHIASFYVNETIHADFSKPNNRGTYILTSY